MNVSQIIIHLIHIKNMSPWSRHLGVLSQAVHFQNLTAASQHVGLSQPQLSRLVAQLEEGLDIVLLDRSVRRKTNWTPLALKLAQVFDHAEHRLTRAMQDLLKGVMVNEIKGACLEGLADLAVTQMGRLAKHPHWRLIHLDILDQAELEERFLSGDADVVWTSRVPGKSKPRHLLQLGFQTLDQKSNSESVALLSRYEFGKARRRHRQKGGPLTVVSNSLRVKELWYEKIGGTGRFPSPVEKDPRRGHVPVLLLGSSLLPEAIWQELMDTAILPQGK